MNSLEKRVKELEDQNKKLIDLLIDVYSIMADSKSDSTASLIVDKLNEIKSEDKIKKGISF